MGCFAEGDGEKRPGSPNCDEGHSPAGGPALAAGPRVGTGAQSALGLGSGPTAQGGSLGSRPQDDPLLGREQEIEFGLVAQKEFKPQQDGHGITGGIAASKLGQQGQRTAQIG